jgi:heptosyltransferase-3
MQPESIAENLHGLSLSTHRQPVAGPCSAADDLDGKKGTTLPRSIFCTAVPGIGDAFLATPLIRGLREAYPGAAIDVLVRRGSEGLVRNQPDIREVLSLSRRPRLPETLAHIRRIWRRYDMAISTSYSDRSLINCWLAAPDRTFILPRDGFAQGWKKWLVDRHIVHDENRNVILQNLALAELLGISAAPQCIVPTPTPTVLSKIGLQHPDKPFILIQMVGSATYKSLPPLVWQEILAYCVQKGQQLVFTGGSSESEVGLAAQMCANFPKMSVSGCGSFSFSQIAGLCTQATAYIGVDTATTHLAAATGVFTIAIFGPGNVNRWAPWPNNWREPINPFPNKPGIHQTGNVVVVKASCTCTASRNHCQIIPPDGATQCLSQIQFSDLQPCIDAAIERALPSLRNCVDRVS